MILGVSHCWIQCMCWQVFQSQRPGQMNCKTHTELIPHCGTTSDYVLWHRYHSLLCHPALTIYSTPFSAFISTNVDPVDKLVRRNLPPATTWNKTLQFTFRFEHSYCSVVLLTGSLTGWDFILSHFLPGSQAYTQQQQYPIKTQFGVSYD